MNTRRKALSGRWSECSTEKKTRIHKTRRHGGAKCDVGMVFLVANIGRYKNFIGVLRENSSLLGSRRGGGGWRREGTGDYHAQSVRGSAGQKRRNDHPTCTPSPRGEYRGQKPLAPFPIHWHFCVGLSCAQGTRNTQLTPRIELGIFSLLMKCVTTAPCQLFLQLQGTKTDIGFTEC